MFIPRICWLLGSCLVDTTFWICRHSLPTLPIKRHGKFLNFYQYVAPIKPRSRRSSGAFLHLRNSLPQCIYLSSFLTFLYRVTASLFSLLSTCKVSHKCRRKHGQCHRSIKEKGTGTKGKSLFAGGGGGGGAWKFPRILAQGKFPDFLPLYK